ncbi:MAG: hypothetical protein EXQ69_04295 [Acidimicrobiia bacterium]|nr:hypothetical protein [Acidimicrobiia bacterium]
MANALGTAVDLDMIAAAILQPHFDAVRDIFVEYHKKNGICADEISKVKLLVDGRAHDAERHFAATTSTGKQIIIAPEGADLPTETLVAITCHEFGHAADFLHPGRWLVDDRRKPAVWVTDEVSDKKKKIFWRRWNDRSTDEIEWAADAIAYTVTGKRVGYCGPCLLQCFDGQERPAGLR